MIKRLLFIFLILFNIFSVYSVQECFFDTKTCDRTTTSFNDFVLTINDANLLDSFDATIYNKDNPTNKIQTIIDFKTNTVSNLQPFTSSGVYVLEVDAKNKAGVITKNNYEFIYDNLEPMPPILSSNLIGNVIIGKTQFANTTIVTRDINNLDVIFGKSDLNGNFKLTLNNLKTGINLIKFYTKNSNGILSAPVERTILSSKISENKNSIISSFVFDDLNLINDRTISLVTSKRNFYVSGSVLGSNLLGGAVFVNGVKSLIDSNNNFASFVLLNEGLNKIVVENLDGSISSSIDVNYINPRFRFLDVSGKKITSNNIYDLNGTTNYDLPFNVYLNGKFVQSLSSADGNFNLKLNNLVSGKNYIYLSGLNSESFSKIIYNDVSSPIIKLMTPTNISQSNKFYFEINDDIGVDINSVVVDFANSKYKFLGDSIFRDGDFYYVDIKDIVDGKYSMTISAKDLSGKSSFFSGNLNIFKSNTVIEDIFSKNGFFIGNKLFFNSQNNLKIILTPSRFISFNSIFLDGVRVYDYEILQNGEVSINLKKLNKNGSLKFTFINNLHESFSEDFSYFTDAESPVVKLDYVESPSSFGNNLVKISGKIVDSNFNFDTLSFNSQKNFIRFGNYFEAFVKLDSNSLNLDIFGNDFSNNRLENSYYGGLFEFDSSNLIFDSSTSSIKSDSISGVFKNSVDRNFKFINSYDGFDFTKIYVNKNGFSLPTSQRSGIRSINLRGAEGSGLMFNDVSAVSVDYVKPKIDFLSDLNGNLVLIFDGTLSPIVKSSLQIKIDGIDYVPTSFCSNKYSYSKYSYCVYVDNNNGSLINVSILDVAGNSRSSSFSFSNVSIISSFGYLGTLGPKVFFSGNDILTNSGKYFLQGQIKSFSKINSVKLRESNVDCSFDDFNFVCPVDLVLGMNSFNVDVRNSQGLGSSSFNISYNDGSNLNVTIDGLFGDSIYKVGSKYFITLSNLTLNSSVSNYSLISYLVNGREVLAGNYNGKFNYNLNLFEDINDKEVQNLEVSILAKDELGNFAIGNSIYLVYNRVVKTLVNIFIN